MAEQVGKFLTELPELETPTDDDAMYIVDGSTASKKITIANLKRVLGGNVTGTVEGASVSFSDGADGIPMEECEVTIVPTQDLHGYSKPWAGGAGKNILPVGEDKTSGTVVFTVASDGVITANGTASATAFGHAGEFTLSAGTYILTGCPTNTDGITIDIRNTYGGSGIVPGADSGNGLTFTLTETTSGVVNIRRTGR